MKTLSFALVIGFSACTSAAPPSKAAVAPQDFAYGILLHGSRGQTLHSFALPESVLRSVVDPELGDLCVFDVNGLQRPLALHVLHDQDSELTELPLAYFPLQAAPTLPNEEHAGDGVEVQVERDPTGNITRAFSKTVATPDGRISYLVDTDALSDPLVGLTLALASPHDFSVRVEVEASEDLAHFHDVTTATLVQLEHHGNTLRRDVIDLPGIHPHYLRLTLHRASATTELALSALEARVARPSKALPRQHVVLEPRDIGTDGSQVFAYALPGAFQVDRYAVMLPSSTALAEAELLASDNPRAAYHVLDHGLFHQNEAERVLTRTDDEFFELRVSDKGGGIRTGAPKLVLGYLAPQLLFVGDEAEPYTLAYGSATARCHRFEEDALLTSTTPPTTTVPLADTVTIGALKTLAGKPALIAPEPPRPLRIYALWAVLLIAVGVLGFVTRKLLRNLGP